jgi:hypothetical protein
MEASIMKLLKSFESIFYVYVEKLPFGFEQMYLLVDFTMLGPTKGGKLKLFYK